MLKRRTASAGFFPQIWDNRKVNHNVSLESLEIPDEGLKIHLRGYGWVTVFKFVAKNGRIDYITTNLENPTRQQIEGIVKAR